MGRLKETLRTAFPELAPLVGLGLLLEAGLVVLAAVVLRMPDSFTNIYGYNASTRRLFAAGWGVPVPPSLGASVFQSWFTGLWLALNGVWLAAFLLARRAKPSPRTLQVGIALAILFQVTLVAAMPPALSTDIYNHLAYGRMVAFYGLNPYTALPSQMGADLTRGLYAWDIVSHYGPVWIGLSTGIAWLGGQGALFAGLLLLKGAAALSHLGIAFLGYQLARHWSGPAAWASGILLAWNPLLLLEGAGNGHNDLLMMALALAGLLAYQRKKPWLGYFLLLLSVMVKYISALLLLFYVLAWLREQAGAKARLRLLGAALGAGLLVAGLAYAPFWQGPATLLGGISEETTHLILSPAAFLRLPLQRLWTLAYPGGPAEQLTLLTINVVQKAGLLILVLWSAWRLWSRAGELLPRTIAAWSNTSLAYICLLHNAIFPWYFIWPFSTAAAEWHRPALRWAVWLSTAFGALSVLFYGIPMYGATV